MVVLAFFAAIKVVFYGCSQIAGVIEFLIHRNPAQYKDNLSPTPTS